ncbi:hypothetical protein [uncultured Aquabacterium sp.]|uniref:hypothetical protein n=1 Tax=uncultured Aquabacterium sp. TaxID=158753 RepID=UPI00344BFFE8
MVLNGYTKGAFVTTSRFQSGGAEVVATASSKGLFIELIDGQRFLDQLKIAQLNDFSQYPELISSDFLGTLELELGNELHCRPL